MDENIKDVLIVVLSGLVGVGGAVVGQWFADRSARARAAEERVAQVQAENRQRIRQVRDRDVSEKRVALRRLVGTIEAMRSVVDTARKEQLPLREWEATREAFTAAKREFDWLFPNDLQVAATKAGLAVTEYGYLYVSGKADTPEFTAAMQEQDKLVRDFKVLARMEVGLEPEHERSMRV